MLKLSPNQPASFKLLDSTPPTHALSEILLQGELFSDTMSLFSVFHCALFRLSG